MLTILKTVSTQPATNTKIHTSTSKSQKGKMRPGKDVVTGPTYMVLAGLPLPVAVPFGYFPFTDKYSSGVIVPTFGDDYNRGFYLRDGGYYFAINDNIDLALTGEIYTKGSWGLAAQSTYSKRYKYNGNFSINYLKTILGDKGMPDYSKANQLPGAMESQPRL